MEKGLRPATNFEASFGSAFAAADWLAAPARRKQPSLNFQRHCCCLEGNRQKGLDNVLVVAGKDQIVLC
jgi:hypothetical protein